MEKVTNYRWCSTLLMKAMAFIWAQEIGCRSSSTFSLIPNLGEVSIWGFGLATYADLLPNAILNLDPRCEQPTFPGYASSFNLDSYQYLCLHSDFKNVTENFFQILFSLTKQTAKIKKPFVFIVLSKIVEDADAASTIKAGVQLYLFFLLLLTKSLQISLTWL